MKLRSTALTLLLQASVGLPLVHGQKEEAATAKPEPVALTNLRAGLLRQVMTESQLLTEQYERALAKAEGEVAATGDYEEARAISQRRTQLRALYAGTASSLHTPLPLAQARLMGASQAAGEMITGWRSSGSGAEWQNFRIVPGAYHLEFEVNMSDSPVAGSIYASSKFQPQEKAEFEFSETSLLGAIPENQHKFEVMRSPDETTFTTLRVGPLQLNHTPVTLRLASSSGYPANIIRIRNLRLTPVSVETPPAATGTATLLTDASAALQQAAATLKTALDDAKTAAVQTYLDDLKKVAANNAELRKQAEAESRRVVRLMDQKTGPTGIRAITATTGGLDGFEDIPDARLSPGEVPEAGDRLTLMHDGNELKVRLLWVSCAPPQGRDKDRGRLRSFAEYFKIDEEEALAMGLAAREFTAHYLRDKPLRLLIRPDRDKDGTVAALIFLPDVGLYQNVLLERGLAALRAPAREVKRSAVEKALLATMQAREDDAKKRQPPAGAWELSADGGNSNGEQKP